MKLTLIRLLSAVALLATSGTQAADVITTPLPLAVEQLTLEQLPLEQKGRAIFEEADKRSSGFSDLEVELQMTLRTAKGSATRRDLRIRQLEVPDDGDRVLVVFDTPADIRGTALLSHAHKLTSDDQWLYLPALKRVKKIASRNKSGAFLGSEFSFEDLATPELEKYTYQYIGTEVLNGQPCFVVERSSTDEYSGYSRERFWLDQEAYRTQQVEYYGLRDEPVKRLQVSDYKLYNETLWKPGRMFMENLRTKKTTELVWHDYQFKLGLSADRDFSVNSLRRAR